MAIPHYLAMTAAEMAASPLPSKAAWMACHFSPYSTGLTNLPEHLPEGSLLILNDRTPIHGHDPERVCAELTSILEKFSCSGLLIDFQNPRTEESAALVAQCVTSLPCPICVPEEYQADNCALFLPPIPTTMPPAEYLSPWAGRELWLETALEGQTIQVTDQGTVYSANANYKFADPFQDNALFCRYCIQETEDAILFHTWRTAEDLQQLLKTVSPLGVKAAVGLYQELGASVIVD